MDRKKMNKNEAYMLGVLKATFRMLDSLEYECASSIYTLDDANMDDVFFCRDIVEACIKEIELSNKNK